MTANTATAATTVEEVRAEMLPDASAAADDAEVAAAMERAGIAVAKPARKAPAKRPAAKKAPAKRPTAAEKKAEAAKAKADEAFAAKVAKAHEAAKAAAASDAPVGGEPTVSVWVGWFIASEAMASKHKGLAAKLAAKKPNGALDRTVRLTKAECEQLAEVATAVENEAMGRKGGSAIVGSARTLRARLDFAWDN
ncbi:hypothetical protein ABC795_11205 [Blastococcus sp. HT6-30]|uniref:hypothetical protein n=1 Tax=Blastococcus sp. HT6-30 TaxID=3144843 RepID=UPI0032195095